MTEKPFLHKKAFSNLKTNFMYHEDLVKILPKIIHKKGILKYRWKITISLFICEKDNPKIKKIIANKNLFPLNQTMNLKKLKKIIN